MRDVQFRTFSIQNFLSIGNEPVELNFTPGVHLITGVNRDKDGRRNGVGKSTVMDAIHWVLFGTPVRDIVKDKIANFRTKGACIGTITFDVTLNGVKSSYTVTRKLSPSKLELTVDGTDKSLSTVAKTTELIQNVLGFNSTLFRNSVALSINNTKPFLAQDKVEKRKFIEGVFNLEVFSEILKDVRARSTETKNQIEVTSAKVEAKKQNVKLYTAQKDNFEVEKAKRVEEAQQAVVKLKEELENTKSKLKDVTDFITKRDNLKDRKKAILSEVKTIDERIDVIKDIIRDVRTKITNVQNDKKAYINGVLSKVEMEIKNLQQQKLNIIKNAKDEAARRETELKKQKDETLKQKSDYLKGCEASICPTCKRPHKEKIEPDINKIAEFNQKIESLEKSILECKAPDTKSEEERIDGLITSQKQIQPDNNELIKFDNNVKELEQLIPKHEADVTEQKQKIDRLQTDGVLKIDQALEKIQETIAANDKVKVAVEYTLKQITTAEKKVLDTQNEKNTFVEMLLNAEKELELLEKEKKEQEKLFAIYESVKYIVSEEGVKTFIIKKMLSALNERIDYYLRKLDANSTCVFNEFFEETIKNDQGIECSYYNFSGAEMKSIDFACLFAFMDIRRMQGDVAINISMYDELFDSSFDEKGLEYVTEILKERVSTNNEAVFVISHRKESLKAATGEVILLEKQNGITKRVQNG